MWLLTITSDKNAFSISARIWPAAWLVRRARVAELALFRALIDGG
jgi:hypothetical protein